MSARQKSVLAESRDVGRAVELISLGARLQVLESETKLSRERLLRLYKEVQGKSPPKGMLPFSTDWFMAIYRFLDKTAELDQIDAIIRAYRLYREQIKANGLPEVLTLTRAWRLVRFFDAGMLTTAPCTCCGGHFVVHTHELVDDYVCGLCDMPSRAGKTRAAEQRERLAA